MLVRIDQRLDKMMIILCQHVITLVESECSHDIVCQVGKPPGHVLILAAKCFKVCNAAAEQLDFFDDDWFVGAQGCLAHGVGDDSSLTRMDLLIRRACQVDQELLFLGPSGIVHAFFKNRFGIVYGLVSVRSFFSETLKSDLLTSHGIWCAY